MGRTSVIEDELRRIAADLAVQDKAALLFAPSTDLGSILARRKRTNLFKHGELLRHILMVLREAREPLTAMQIAKAVKTRTKLKQDILPNVKRSLRGQSKAWRLKEVGKRWEAKILGRARLFLQTILKSRIQYLALRKKYL